MIPFTYPPSHLPLMARQPRAIRGVLIFGLVGLHLSLFVLKLIRFSGQ